MSFAERVLDLLEEKNISQSKMLSDLGLGKNQLTYWRKQKNVPSALVVEKIAKYLDVSAGYLLGNTDIKKEPITSRDELPKESQEIFDRLIRLNSENLALALEQIDALLKHQEKP